MCNKSMKKMLEIIYIWKKYF